MIIIKNIKINDSESLKEFLNNIGDSENSFRYFKNRDIDVINNHLITCLLYENSIPIAYAHLDEENGKVWLGIAVIENKKGKGLGNMLMEHLINFATEQNLNEIFLTVDLQNINAIKLYQKFHFEIEAKKNEYFLMKLILK